MLIVLGLSMAACGAIAMALGDPPGAVRGLFGAGATALVLGAAGAWPTRGSEGLSRRDGFGIVTFGWLAAALAGSLPYLYSGVIPHPVSAVFESMSGLTTTGASVLADLESMPRGILLWRSLTHFFGGMGVLILCLAILPFIGGAGMQIFRAEMPGPSKDRLTPRIATTAKLLWGVYALLCIAQTLLLKLGGMSWFDALCHTFGTMATGGFSTRTASVGAYDSIYIEIVVMGFMFLAGTNFALHYRALRGRPLDYFRDSEFRWYLGIWAGSCLLLTIILHGSVGSLGEALRAAFFQGTSILTTTGFITRDFDQWPETARVLLVALMFIGGCAGSTGGGMKVTRVVIVMRKVIVEIRRFMRPQAVLTIRNGPNALPAEAVTHIAAFVLMFLFLFFGGTILMTIWTPDIETAFSSVAATLGNIGPGLSAVGAMRNYAEIPAAGQALLTFFMLLGRLELYTVLIVLTPAFWRE